MCHRSLVQTKVVGILNLNVSNLFEETCFFFFCLEWYLCYSPVLTFVALNYTKGFLYYRKHVFFREVKIKIKQSGEKVGLS